MTFATYEDHAMLPVWRNHVAAQLLRASVGHLSGRIHALGFTLDGRRLCIHAQIEPRDGGHDAELDAIRAQFDASTGGVVESALVVAPPSAGIGDPTVDWVYLRYRGDETFD